MVTALLLSLMLHLVVLLGVTVKPSGQSQPAASGPLQMRIVASPPVTKTGAQQAAELPAPKTPQESVVRSPVPSPTPSQAAAAPAAQPVSPPSPAVASAAPAQESKALAAVDVPLMEDPVYYPAKQLDVLPMARESITPDYPEAAVHDNVSGKVKLLLLIDATGQVVDASVVEATPPGYFEDAAIAAFRHAHFSPAVKNGKKVRSRVLIEVSFNLVPPATTLLH